MELEVEMEEWKCPCDATVKCQVCLRQMMVSDSIDKQWKRCKD